ncbi:terminase [Dysgonomonas sp. 216]|uniref:PBSX family phage terminase large subunit n=1 Tax=Dysgonomonas sp. 216 TaxID=2302934 RepID=UPI0013D06FC2|nr:terminase large subunit [Dysgonomonas sp. 216]NDW19476.1 terminase [Dysgonomonas sp. 216]
MKATSVFSQNLAAYNQNQRLIVNKGSTRSSKTWSVLQLLCFIAQSTDQPLLISVVSEAMPHLKRGCIRDFENMLQQEGSWNRRNWNATDKIYTIGNSRIEFFSADQPGKVHGPSRDILYINECINIPYETYRQLSIRTTRTVFLDYNPCHEFWVDEHILPRVDCRLIKSTYVDNEFLTKAQVDEIESNKHDEDWWMVYGKGETGAQAGLVMKKWDVVSSMPEDYKYRWLGVDFGFTNDPTVIVDVRLHEGELWIDELLYAKGCDNIQIAEFLSDNDIPRDTPIVGDSSEPKSISEIRSFGWQTEPSIKGKDSVNLGLSILNRYNKHITSRSANIIKEYRNYKWQTDVTGASTNIPIDRMNHSIDAQRYVVLNKLVERKKAAFDYFVGK